MKIKSEFMNKSSEWFPELKLWMVLLSFLFGGFLSILIIGIGAGIGFKIIFAIIGFITIIIYTFDRDNEDIKELIFKRGLIIVLLSFLIAEIPLYYNQDFTKVQNIKVLITDETRGETIKEKYKKARFYDIDTNEEIGSRIIESNEQGKEQMYLNITGKTFYIDYFPFFRYSEEFKYIRDKNITK